MKIEKILNNRFENNILRYCKLFNNKNLENIYLGEYIELSIVKMTMVNNVLNSIFEKYNSMIITEIELPETILNKGFKMIDENITSNMIILIHKEKGFVYCFNFENYDEIKSFVNIVNNRGTILTNLEEISL